MIGQLISAAVLFACVALPAFMWVTEPPKDDDKEGTT